MGMYASYFLGPYLRCVSQPVRKNRTILACLNKECDKYSQPRTIPGSFCNKCGSPITEGTVQEEGSSVSPWDVTEDINDALCPFGGEFSRKFIDIYIANQSPTPAPREYHFDKYEPHAVDTEHTPESIQKDLDWFTTGFASQIDIVNGHYGSENVKVCWGHVGAYS